MWERYTLLVAKMVGYSLGLPRTLVTGLKTIESSLFVAASFIQTCKNEKIGDSFSGVADRVIYVRGKGCYVVFVFDIFP